MAIHQTGYGWVIASRRMWLPGSFDSQTTARYAFQFTDAELQHIADTINAAEQRPATMDDLRQLRARRAASP